VTLRDLKREAPELYEHVRDHLKTGDRNMAAAGVFLMVRDLLALGQRINAGQKKSNQRRQLARAS
jgi:hypothetical protein